MFNFYSPDLEYLGSDAEKESEMPKLWILSPDESYHAIGVLRLSQDSRVRILNGRGICYEGVIVRPDPRACQIRLLSIIPTLPKPYFLNLVFAPTKNLDRTEWLIEKATEIGVDYLSPIICQNSERRNLNTARLSKILISALKQCGDSYIPQLSPVRTFAEFLNSPQEGNLWMAHCRDRFRSSIPEAIKKAEGESFTVLIGPEGDFSEMEIKLLEAKNYGSIHLGARRLRTETAGIVVCAQLSLLKSNA